MRQVIQGLLAAIVLKPEIYDIIVGLEPGKDGKVQLTDAIDKLHETQRFFAKRIEATRYDVGNQMGYM